MGGGREPASRHCGSGERAQTTSISPLATTTCSYTFASGSNNSYLSYCVTANGNIPQITTPFGHSHLGSGGEGYGICNESPATEYHDYATGDSGNWASARVVSKTSTSVKIARFISDGNWTLTQTITQVANTSSITIVMALKNNQAVSRVVYLVCYADVNGDSQASTRWVQPSTAHLPGLRTPVHLTTTPENLIAQLDESGGGMPRSWRYSYDAAIHTSLGQTDLNRSSKSSRGLRVWFLL